MANSVVLLSQTEHVGGMVSGGLSHTDIIRPGDIDNRLLVGGIAIEFFELNTRWYRNTSHGDTTRERSRPSDSARNKDSNSTVWDVEPHVAAILFRQMLSSANVTLLLNASIVTVAKEGTRITSMQDQSGRTFAADMWIDASYEGDLLALAGASFAVGREAASVYNESIAGFTGGSSPQFPHYINPYVTNATPGRGVGRERGDEALLPLVDSIPPDLSVGDGDNAVASYNVRLCITNRSDNRVPLQPPVGYDSADYELIRRSKSFGLGAGTSSIRTLHDDTPVSQARRRPALRSAHRWAHQAPPRTYGTRATWCRIPASFSFNEACSCRSGPR
eukprot:m.161374 g.161374  ORF g.161374 m.161374 type:complete len:333 (-) comp14574_c0_seq1:526-1524(-)